jgi:hypothetical protein
VAEKRAEKRGEAGEGGVEESRRDIPVVAGMAAMAAAAAGISATKASTAAKSEN